MRVCVYVVEFARDVRFFSPDFEMQVFPILFTREEGTQVHARASARRALSRKERRRRRFREKETAF